MSKLTTLFTIALLLSLMLSYAAAARPDPAFSSHSMDKTQQGDGEVESMEVDESCEGVGKEDCLVRRTLAAHVDYIYTQKHKP